MPPTNNVPIRARIAPTQRRKKKDPREVKVQVNVQVPRWYREQLYDYCDETGKTFASVVVGSMLEKVPPRKPALLAAWPPPFYFFGYVDTGDEPGDES